MHLTKVFETKLQKDLNGGKRGEVGRLGSREVWKLGRLEVGKLGSWDVGKLGGLEVRDL